MITLRPMRTEEFPAYRDYFIVDYAAEIAANFGLPPARSKEIARKELAADLPLGAATPDNILCCIENSASTAIGYLWYRLLEEGATAFILDFYMFEPYRGQGLGKATLTALELQLIQSGVAKIELRVAFHNKRAFGLYNSLGFMVTGYNMAKNLGTST